MKVKQTTNILTRLRSIMSNSSDVLHAVIVPSSDAHQSEYLAECDLRRAFLSGFTGSAGTAVVTQSEAALWTDGRYFLQADAELDNNWKLMKMGLKGTPSIEEWLCSVLPPNSTVGINPFLYSSKSWNTINVALKKKGHDVIGTATDLVDQIWDDRPEMPNTPLHIVDPEVSGKSSQEKIEDFRQLMKEAAADWLVITALDEVAWLFNLRASDIQYNPVFFAYCVIGTDTTHIFINKSRITAQVKKHLTNSVTIHDYDEMLSFLQSNCSSSKTWLSSNSSHAIVSAITPEFRIVNMYSPVSLAKCVKNSSEIAGMISANNKDAVALCRFYHWMEQNVPLRNVTECSAASQLQKFREEEKGFVCPSFQTISSTGPSGSIIHYSPSPDDDKTVQPDQLYLCDAGSQFRGTFLSSIVFPSGTKGFWLDTLARMHLWKAGLDYLHGTGHGVGSYLNVHEGPVGAYIGNSSRVVTVAADVELQSGMVITDEPGYYEDGKFGIRIENALLCQTADTKYNFQGKTFHKFEPLALIPIQQKLIDQSLLTPDEVAWLNHYHQRCRDVIGRELKARKLTDTYEWLMKQTENL